MTDEQVRFSDPPVRNVMLTLYFAPLQTLQVSHLASLRERWRGSYPNVAEFPPLRPLNRGGEESSLFSLEGAWPFPYVMFASDDERQVIAIQNDRLVRSWIFSEDGEDYPGFDQLSAELASALEEFQVVAREELGQNVDLIASECHYDNELPALPSEQLLVGISTRWAYEVSHTGITSSRYAGVRIHCDDEELSQLSATVMLDIEADEEPSLGIKTRYTVLEGEDPPELGGLRVAHDKLIGHFLTFTSEEMQKGWGRQS